MCRAFRALLWGLHGQHTVLVIDCKDDPDNKLVLATFAEGELLDDS